MIENKNKKIKVLSLAICFLLFFVFGVQKTSAQFAEPIDFTTPVNYTNQTVQTEGQTRQDSQGNEITIRGDRIYDASGNEITDQYSQNELNLITTDFSVGRQTINLSGGANYEPVALEASDLKLFGVSGVPTDISGLIRTGFNVFLAFIVIAALVTIVIGGIEIMTSETPFKTQKGKDHITSAIAGLILALASVLILETINPQLIETDITRNAEKIQGVQGDFIDRESVIRENVLIPDGAGNSDWRNINNHWN